MSHQDQNPCPQHGEHHGICWPCADARGRKANAAEAALEAARAEVARMRPVVEAAVGFVHSYVLTGPAWTYRIIEAVRTYENRRTPEPAKDGEEKPR